MSSATVTAKQGIGNTVTAKSFANIRGFNVDLDRYVLRILKQNDDTEEFDINAATTFTVTIAAAGGSYSLTVS